MTALLIRVPAADVLTDGGRERLRALAGSGRVDAVVLAHADDTDPSTASAYLGARHPDLDVVIEASFGHDFVYNLARRVASLHALSDRACGVLLPAGDTDAVVSLHLLWQSWPRDSILGDRETGRFVDASRIRRVDRGGAHAVAGPLQIPVDQNDPPVVLQRFDPARPDGARAADAVVVPPGVPAPKGAVTILESDAAGLPAALAVRPAGVLVDVPPDLDVLAAVPARSAGGLRRRLGLGAPPVSLDTPASVPAVEGW
ncbi:hypothetical protein [Microbacterium sp. SORGH_AS_0888]|uniref:hypothetical protein n=1 Tax=Microbacterium sp. SORGH_AS_0888 TaxID=3041791 RepID=UPI002789C2B3|nr:hypothetical protein [Microbacterium sp. SORGH_AS_0888]MDQ1130550.1 hypothetical protein [Microbacterium sp. SORGH_AS_0888]